MAMTLTPEQQRDLDVAQAAARAAAQKSAAPEASVTGGSMPPANFTDRVVNSMTFGLSKDADALAHATAGQIRAWLNRTPYDFGKGYNEGRVASRARLEKYGEDHPVASKAADVLGIVGNVAGTTKNIALNAPTLLGKVVQGTGIGGEAGALTGIGEGGDGLAARAKSAAIGGGMGAVVGGAVPVVAAGAGRMLSRVKNPAVQRIARALMDDGYTPQQAQQTLDQLGPDAVMADLGPNLQRQAGAIASVPGRGQQVVRDAIMTRAKGANSRIIGDLDATLGKAVIPSQADDALVQAQRALGPKYEAAFRGARAVDTQSLADTLGSEAVNLRGPAQKAVQQVRKMLNVAGTDVLDPNPRTLMATRNAIDGMIKTEADPNVIRVLTGARKQIDAELTKAVPGIKPIDAIYEDLARQREALTRGQQVLDSGRMSPRPAELAREYAAGSPGVQQHLSAGARAEIDRIVGTKSNDVVALQGLIKGEGSWNRDRLATLFGADKADRIIKVLERERLFADTTNVVTRNSETAARLAAQGEIAPAPGTRDGMFRAALNLKAGDAVAKALDYASSAVRGSTAASRQAATNEALARLLVAPRQGPQDPAIQAVVQALMKANRGKTVEEIFGRAMLPVAPRYVASGLVQYLNPPASTN